jgi:hypothetical protein
MELVTSRKLIAHHYMTGFSKKEGKADYFPTWSYMIDVISCMPIDTVVFYTVGIKASMYVRLIRFLRAKELVEALPHW